MIRVVGSILVLAFVGGLHPPHLKIGATRSAPLRRARRLEGERRAEGDGDEQRNPRIGSIRNDVVDSLRWRRLPRRRATFGMAMSDRLGVRVVVPGRGRAGARRCRRGCHQSVVCDERNDRGNGYQERHEPEPTARGVPNRPVNGSVPCHPALRSASPCRQSPARRPGITGPHPRRIRTNGGHRTRTNPCPLQRLPGHPTDRFSPRTIGSSRRFSLHPSSAPTSTTSA